MCCSVRLDEAELVDLDAVSGVFYVVSHIGGSFFFVGDGFEPVDQILLQLLSLSRGSKYQQVVYVAHCVVLLTIARFREQAWFQLAWFPSSCYHGCTKLFIEA